MAATGLRCAALPRSLRIPCAASSLPTPLARCTSARPPTSPPSMSHGSLAAAPAAPAAGASSVGAAAAAAQSHASGLQSTAPPLRLRPAASMQQIVAEIVGPEERLEPDVEALLLDLADDFVENVASFACVLARHRQSHTLDVQDLKLHLEKSWQLHVPGYALPNSLPGAADAAAGTGGASGAPAAHLGPAAGVQVRAARRGPLFGVGEAHRKRLALVQRLHNKEAKRAAAAAAAAAGTAGGGAAGAGLPTTAGADGKGGASAAAAAAVAHAKKRKRPNEE